VKSPAWRWIAASTLGCEWPTLRTETPDAKSTKRLPSTSSTTAPSARRATTGEAFVAVARISRSRAMIAFAFGPGGVTRMWGAFMEDPSGPNEAPGSM